MAVRRTDTASLLCGLLAAAVLVPGGPLRAEDRRESTVGMPARIDQIVLPGSELKVGPPEDRRAPVVLRIARRFPHGSAFRYDLVYHSLEPGTFDLRDYLRRKDGSSVADLPPLRVTIKPVLPPGQVLPNELEARPSRLLAWYRPALIAGGVLWVVVLVAILLVGRRRRGGAGTGPQPLTLADRLRPLVEGAMTGSLTQAQRADLERTLLAYWRRRLGLGDRKPADTFAVLRAHPEAGPLLERLEAWLHRPGRAGDVDVGALLSPYRVAPAGEDE